MDTQGDFIPETTRTTTTTYDLSNVDDHMITMKPFDFIAGTQWVYILLFMLFGFINASILYYIFFKGSEYVKIYAVIVFLVFLLMGIYFSVEKTIEKEMSRKIVMEKGGAVSGWVCVRNWETFMNNLKKS